MILGELASEYDYWSKAKGLTEDGYFFSTIENIEDKTTLSEHKQRKALKTLEEHGLIKVSVRGMPAKRYVKINEAKLFEIFEDKPINNSSASSEKIDEPVLENLSGNDNIANNNNINKNIVKEPVKTGRKSRKDQITEYVDGLEYLPETKDILYKWIFQIGLAKGVTVNQLQDMLKQLWEDCNNNEYVVREAIKKSYLNNWFGFYANVPKTAAKAYTASVSNMQRCTDAEIKKRPLVSDETF